MIKYSYIIGGVGIPATNGLRHMKTYNIYFGVSRILEREREVVLVIGQEGGVRTRYLLTFIKNNCNSCLYR